MADLALIGSVAVSINGSGVIAQIPPGVTAITGSVSLQVGGAGVVASQTPAVLAIIGSVGVALGGQGIITQAVPTVLAQVGSVGLQIAVAGVVRFPSAPPVLAVVGSVAVGVGGAGVIATAIPPVLAIIGSVGIAIGEFRVPELTVVQLLSPADLILSAVIGSVGLEVGGAGVITQTTPPVYAVPVPQAAEDASVQIRVAGIIALIHPQILEVIGDAEVLLGGGLAEPDIFATFVLTGFRNEPSIYSNFNFNSYARFRHQYYGAGEDGIYLLDGPDDAGEEIHPGVRIGPINFGTDREKRLRLLRCGGKTYGAQVKVSNGNGSAGYYDVEGGRAATSLEVHGRELTIEITDFETLDHLEIIPLVLSHR